MDFITKQKNSMETIYTLTGWVKKVIDKENAKLLQEINISASGELGKETLMQYAKQQLEIWNNCYPQKKRKYIIVYACIIFANTVCKTNGILTRGKTIFSKIEKS